MVSPIFSGQGGKARVVQMFTERLISTKTVYLVLYRSKEIKDTVPTGARKIYKKKIGIEIS